MSMPNSYINEVLDYILKSNNLILKLYKNNHNPTESSSINSLEELESVNDFILYKELWSISGGTATYGQQVDFIFDYNTTNIYIYGYFITDSTNNLIIINRFENAPLFLNSGSDGTLSITIKISLSNQ